MTTLIDHIEVRWRPTGSQGVFQTQIIKPSQGTVTIPGIERGVSYDVEARSVSARGTASDWVPVQHTVALANMPLGAPTGLTAISLADGVHLAWVTGDTQLRADTEFEIWRAPDNAGSPGAFALLTTLRGTAYTDGVTDGVVRWYEVREKDQQGNYSAFTAAISSAGKTVANGATNGATIGPGGNVNGAVDVNGRAQIDFTQGGHLGKVLDNIPNGPIYTRSVATADSAGSIIIENANCAAAADVQGNLPGWDNSTLTSGGAWYIDTASPDTGYAQDYVIKTPAAAAGLISATRKWTCHPGDIVSIKARVRAFNGTYSGAFIDFYSAAGGYLGSAQAATTANAWTTAGQSVSAPAGTSYAQLVFYCGTPASGNAYAALQWVRASINDVRVAGSGAQIGDQRNLPQLAVLNYRAKYAPALSFSSAAGSPATATMTVGAATALIGNISVSYGTMSVSVTGTGGNAVTYFLYFDDPAYAGGTPVLNATTNGNDCYAANGRVFAGSISFTFPTSGSGTGGGLGGLCVADDMWISEGLRAGDAKPGDWFDCVDLPTRLGKHRRQLIGVTRGIEECVRLITSGGARKVVSISTPFDLPDSRRLLAPKMLHELVLTDRGIEPVVEIQPVGPRPVSRNHLGGISYAGGEDPRYRIYSHNATQKP